MDRAEERRAYLAQIATKYYDQDKTQQEIADEMGLDCVLEGLEELFQQYGERFRPARLLKTKVRAGHLGVKAGRGFHEYA